MVNATFSSISNRNKEAIAEAMGVTIDAVDNAIEEMQKKFVILKTISGLKNWILDKKQNIKEFNDFANQIYVMFYIINDGNLLSCVISN